MNEFNFNERLENLMLNYEMTPSMFADKIGVQRSGISHLLSGRNNPSLDFIIKVLDNFPEISFEWLAKGKGNMFNSKNGVVSNSSHTPTLFDQFIESPEKLESKPKIEMKIPHNIKETDHKLAQNETKTKKPIDRLLVLYKDGSFETFYNTEG